MKQGFSLIELIMTIVIISIAFATLPMIIENTTKTIDWLQTSKAISFSLRKIQTIKNENWNNIDTSNNDIDTNNLHTTKTTIKNIKYIDLIDGNLSIGTLSGGESDIKEVKVKVSNSYSSISTYRYYKTNITTTPAYIKGN